MATVGRTESGGATPIDGDDPNDVALLTPSEPDPGLGGVTEDAPAEPPPPPGFAEARRQDTRFTEARTRWAIEGLLAENDPPATGGRGPREPASVADITRRARAEAQEANAAAQGKANDAKFIEYLDVAQDLAGRGVQGYRSEGDYLLGPDPMKEQAWKTLANRLMDVAHEHRNDPEFAKSDPGTVVDRLLQDDPQVKLAFQLMRRSPVPHEYIPLPDEDKGSLLGTAIDALVGLIPVVGDAADASAALTGRSISGQKLEGYERAVAGVCAMIPLLNSSHLRAGMKGVELIADAAKQTGRGAHEIEAMFRLVDHMPASDAQVIRRAADELLAGRKLSPELAADANRVVGKLSGDLEEIAAQGIKRRPRDPFTGEPFKVGTAEHKQQRWIEHQARNRSEFPEWKSDLDPAWNRAYDRAVKNRETGSAFETAALAKRDLPKNNEILISGDAERSFIPDGIRDAGGQAVGEVKWGEPYHFVEAKNVADLSHGGNLKAEMDYVKEFGGHLDLVIRKDTKLTGPLAKELEAMRRRGQVDIYRE